MDRPGNTTSFKANDDGDEFRLLLNTFAQLNLVRTFLENYCSKMAKQQCIADVECGKVETDVECVGTEHATRRWSTSIFSVQMRS